LSKRIGKAVVRVKTSKTCKDSERDREAEGQEQISGLVIVEARQAKSSAKDQEEALLGTHTTSAIVAARMDEGLNESVAASGAAGPSSLATAPGATATPETDPL
jgi:hypothetical protein